jgi:hypothetical protein
MSSIVVSGDTSGAVTLTVPSVAGTNTVTIAAQTGTLNAAGPAFSAYNTSAQSITTATPTKVTLDTEVFDTNNNFASSRFTPTVAGYYQINGLIRVTGTAITGGIAEIYKNGSVYAYGQAFDGLGPSSAQIGVSEIVYLNGSTDYVELWGYITATSPAFGYATPYINCRFSGALVRGA